MKYQNPIIRGFNPDPSICRGGGDYYLVTSSFAYFPGIPVYHSTDLVNWEQIGNCVDRIGQLPLDSAQISGGIWAPTIRFHEGTFYVTATFSGVGNFIICSADPAGVWSDPVWVEMDGIDPSMFFEDGKMYYCANDCGSRQRDTEGISLARMDVDTGKVVGQVRRIWEGTGDEAGVAIYLTPDFMYRIFKRREEAGDYIVVQKVADDLIQTACHEKIADGIIRVRIRADRHSYTFYYAVNDGEMHCACKASTRFLACELAGKCFTGTVIGIYAQAEKRTDAVAKYYCFRQTRTEEGGKGR